MNSKITKLVAPVYKFSSFVLSGALVFGLFQLPITPNNTDTATNHSLQQTVKNSFAVIEESLATPHAEAAEISLGSIFFGKTALAETEDQLIAKKMEFVSTRKAYPASLSVIKKHEKTIREKARANGVPEDVAIGVGLLENGGSETAKSPAGALGVFQLMPGTARSLGLTVNKTVDERRDPVKNIDAGMRYLKSNYDRFGDWGLATWAYHAGEGNVSKAVQMYAKANSGISLPGVNNPAKIKAYVVKNKITIDRLLSSAAVKPLTKKLNDDSAGYPYKVIATANLYKQGKTRTSVVPGEIVKNR